MICKDCSVAADLITQANTRSMSVTKDKMSDPIHEVSEYFHGFCNPNKCDCQHLIVLTK